MPHDYPFWCVNVPLSERKPVIDPYFRVKAGRYALDILRKYALSSCTRSLGVAASSTFLSQ